MALETVVYSQDPLSYYGFKDFYSLMGGSNWGYDLCLQHQQDDEDQFDREDKSSLVGFFNNNITDQTQNGHHDIVHANWDYSSSSPPDSTLLGLTSPEPNPFPEPGPANPPAEVPATGRRKRRRARSSKNKEELETQRMTHIAVERNRRKQMNEYLAVLRSLMPPSYVQRGDQASIVGGAINFVKELEQLLQSTESRVKRTKEDQSGQEQNRESSNTQGLTGFLTFPQYSTRGNSSGGDNSCRLGVADIEVTMVDSHANLKIVAKKRPRLLLNLVSGLQALGLALLHLNVTTADQMVLYSVSVKIEEGSQLNTVDDIAASVNQMLGGIQDEPVFK